jgi:hypothetical protein
MKKMTTKIFIERAILKHGNDFCYSKVDYINSQTKILLKCKMGHEFFIRPDMHLNRGDGCRLCKNNNMLKDNDIFIKELKKIYKNRYDYSMTEYNGVYNDVYVICKKHGSFKISPNKLLRGQGCNKCCVNGKLDTTEFINRSNVIHKNRYDYSKSIYINSRTKIDIICKKHGLFSQLSNNHLAGHGCNKCNRSIGEVNIENFLSDNKVIYKTEFVFDNLKYKYPLRFDFAILENNDVRYLIEYNGKQHYEYYPVFHRSVKEFNESLLRDNMKIKYCDDNNIKLYVIRYDDDLYTELEKIINENEKENRI